MSGDSILHRLEQDGRQAPRVALRGTSEPPSASDGSSAGSSQSTARRYEVLGEIARGGVGVVHRGHDNDLGRDVALKVLHPEHLANADLVQRFVEEAQIGGQLQHPGIVPVYELGLESDARPFFAMKLVKGETLAKRLAERTSPSDGRRALLTVFRDVCRTLSYAHARGVIHRDLKPSNVMIGGFGEVQVVDWGLAKVLARGGVADERLRKKAARDVTMIATVRTGAGSSHSLAGSVMGTPAYMPPEQALGRVDDLDERSDVFSLGAILCEILTGSPPYAGDHTTVLTAAAGAQLDDARAALDACDADERLVALCRRCLEPLPKNRPASVDLLADEVAAWLADAEQQAHRAELARVEAEAEAEEERRAKRQTRRVAAAGVLVVSAALATAIAWNEGRAQRARDRRAAIEVALEDATRSRAAESWDEALAAAERAIALGADDAVLTEIRAEAEAATEAARIAAEDDAFLAELEDIRGRRGSSHDLPASIGSIGWLASAGALRATSSTSSPFGMVGSSADNAGEFVVQNDEATDAAFAAAFARRFGSPDAGLDRLARSPRAKEFAASVAFWCYVRKVALEREDWEDLALAAERLDPEHGELFDILWQNDREELLALGKRDALDVEPAVGALIGDALIAARESKAAIEFVDRLLLEAPDEFWLHIVRADASHDWRDFEGMARHATAATAIRPGHAGGWRRLSDALGHAGRLNLSIARRAVELAPKAPNAHWGLGRVLYAAGDLDGAAAEMERAIELEPGNGLYYRDLGSCRSFQGDVDGAVEAYERALSLLSGDRRSEVAVEYARLFVQRKQGEIVLASLRQALEKTPEDATLHLALAIALLDGGDVEGAVAAAERSLEIDPDPGAAAIREIAWVYRDVRPQRAISLLRRAVELAPRDSGSWAKLGSVLRSLGQLEEAEEALRTAIDRTPEDADALEELGGLCDQLGEVQAATELFRRTTEMEPENAWRWSSYGTSLTSAREYSSAVEALRRAVALDPELAAPYCNLGNALRFLGESREAAEAYRRAIELTGGKAAPWNDGSRLDEDALQGAYNMLGHALEDVGDLEAAVEATRIAYELDPDRSSHGVCLARQEAKLDALRKYERRARGEDVAMTLEEVDVAARVLFDRSDFDVATEAFALALELAAPEADAHSWGRWMAICSAALTEDHAWHEQILAWFYEELARYAELLESDPEFVAQRMQWFRDDADVRSIRDVEPLPPGFAELWDAVDALLEEATR